MREYRTETEEATGRQRQRLQRCGHKAKPDGCHWKLGRQGGSFPGASRGSVALLTPQFQTFALQNSERINFCCFKPQVGGNLFQQPSEININILICSISGVSGSCSNQPEQLYMVGLLFNPFPPWEILFQMSWEAIFLLLPLHLWSRLPTLSCGFSGLGALRVWF